VGKTTTVRILSTLIRADRGMARIAGYDLNQEADQVRAVIGVTGQFSAVDNLLTGEENLILMADLHHLGKAEGRRRAAGLLDRFGLAGAARKLAATYSGGMRRRLDLAMTLVGDPRIIFLDEPTSGLDPRGRRDWPFPASAPSRRISSGHQHAPGRPATRVRRVAARPGQSGGGPPAHPASLERSSCLPSSAPLRLSAWALRKKLVMAASGNPG
jgi:hypothetical protein